MKINQKIILVLTHTKENKKKYPLPKKTNNQAHQIICLFVVSRYNFHF